ncbi:hypothetical protein SDC9_179605 [bioreactor metagenome]|uniref:Uncharacterized protein n=1 Tax=bioreactor metagenome TaxID=1076179 RepID=A0A645H2A4_9ZZZZ
MGRASRGHQPVPRQRLVALHAHLLQRRRVRQQGRTLRAGHSQRAQPARTQVGHGGHHAVDGEIHLSAHQVGRHWRLPFIGHVRDVDARHRLQQHHRKMLRRAVAGRAKRVRARPRLQHLQQRGGILRRAVPVDLQHHRHGGDQRDRREVL